MPAPRIAFATPPQTPRWKRWLVYSPLARIVLFALMMGMISVALHAGVSALGWNADAASPLEHALASLAMQLPPALIAYLILVTMIECRAPSELAVRDIPRYGLAGLVIGCALFSLVDVMLWLAGSYHVMGFNPDVHWLPAVLVAGIGAGIGEEIITRGVLFRVIEEGLGTWWALAISAAFFGIAHSANPGATLWSSISIMIEAGVLLALLYHVTRSLWACIGLHAAWNIAEGTLYGVKVSGTKADGFIQSTLTGPEWLSGGAFGAEASVVALLVCLGVSAALLTTAIARGTVVRPSWTRRHDLAQTPASGTATRMSTSAG